MSLTKRQQKIRATGYGSSEVATICGLNRWESPIKVYERKVLEQTAGRSSGDAGSVQAALGNLLEEPVAQLYARRTGHHLRRVQTITHPGRAIVVATPDRAIFTAGTAVGSPRNVLSLPQLAGALGLLEVKTVDDRDRKQYGEPGSDVVPEEKLAQVTWQMGATGLQRADLAVLFGRRAWEIFTVKFNPALFDSLFELVERFDVDHVRARRPPPVDASDAYAAYLARVHASPIAPARLMTSDEEQLVVRFFTLKGAEKRIEVLLKQAKNELRAIIGDAAGIQSGKLGDLMLPKNKGKTSVDFEAAFVELRALCQLIVQSMPSAKGKAQLAAQIEQLLVKHTKAIDGYRWFQSKPIKGGPHDFKGKPIALELPVLGAGVVDDSLAKPASDAEQ